MTPAELITAFRSKHADADAKDQMAKAAVAAAEAAATDAEQADSDLSADLTANGPIVDVAPGEVDVFESDPTSPVGFSVRKARTTAQAAPETPPGDPADPQSAPAQ